MSTPFVGVVEVKDETSQFSTVTLDGNKASVLVGGSPAKKGVPGAQDGQIKLLDQHGITAISLSANPGVVLLQNSANKQQAYLGNGRLNLGGNGSDGGVNLFPQNAPDFSGIPEKPTIKLSASAGDATVSAGLAQVSDGRILLLGKDGHSNISMETGAGFAGLQLGSPGQFGDPATQSEIDLFNTQSASSDSHHSAISIRSSDASIRAGGNLGQLGSTFGSGVNASFWCSTRRATKRFGSTAAAATSS
jgi:hypothetical protein